MVGYIYIMHITYVWGALLLHVVRSLCMWKRWLVRVLLMSVWPWRLWGPAVQLRQPLSTAGC